MIHTFSQEPRFALLPPSQARLLSAWKRRVCRGELSTPCRKNALAPAPANLQRLLADKLRKARQSRKRNRQESGIPLRVESVCCELLASSFSFTSCELRNRGLRLLPLHLCETQSPNQTPQPKRSYKKLQFLRYELHRSSNLLQLRT